MAGASFALVAGASLVPRSRPVAEKGDEDGFARLHVIRRYHRDDTEIAELYASWIKVNGARALLEHGDLYGWIDRAEERRTLSTEMSKLDAALEKAGGQDHFVTGIADAYESLRASVQDAAAGR